MLGIGVTDIAPSTHAVTATLVDVTIVATSSSHGIVSQVLKQTHRVWESFDRVLFVIIIIGFGLRVRYLSTNSIDEHPARRLLGLLEARANWARLGGGPTELRAVTLAAVHPDRSPEPEIMPRIVGALYRLTGGEHVTTWPLLSTVAWLSGVVALFIILKYIRDRSTALLAASLMSFTPFIVRASTWELADPIAIGLGLVGCACALRYLRTNRSRTRTTTSHRLHLLAAICLTGFAVALKITVIFLIVPLLFALIICVRANLISSLFKSRDRLLLIGVSVAVTHFYLVPSAMNLLYDNHSTTSLKSSFVPDLLTRSNHWVNVWHQLSNTCTPIATALALVAIISTRDARRLLWPLTVGVATYFAVFTYHTGSHSYYHLVTFPSIAIGASIATSVALKRLNDYQVRRTFQVMCTLVLTFLALSAALNQSAAAFPLAPRTDKALGELVGHSQRVMSIEIAYSEGLRFYGHVGATSVTYEVDRDANALWNVVLPSAQESIETNRPEWFISQVPGELDANDGLRVFLDTHATKVHSSLPANVEVWRFTEQPALDS